MSYDPDAQSYFTAVESVSGLDLRSIQPWLTPDYIKFWINDLVISLKSTGCWDAINTAVLLRCAQSLTGALVPLKGTAPTNANFVEGDYNGQTGLKGNAGTKRLNTNVGNGSFTQNSFHMSLHITETDTINNTLVRIMGTSANTGSSLIHLTTSNLFRLANQGNINDFSSSRPMTGFVGHNRSSSSVVNYNIGYVPSSYGSSISTASQVPLVEPIYIFSLNGLNPTDARISWYTIGSAINIDTLRACYEKFNDVITNQSSYDGTCRRVLNSIINIR